ncbi:MAG: Hsp20 family protein, partial [Methanothrix sp.]|nr:Hsp20 family protein [Methanothrix sp.]
IDILASDHAPHLPEEKRDDIWEAPPGVPGVETLLPLMLFSVRRNLISLDRLVNALATRPAEIFGLESKGSIEIGKDADLVIVNPKNIGKIDANRLHSRADWTPYQGKEAIFPQMTLIRGSVIYDGDVQVRRGFGHFQPRQIMYRVIFVMKSDSMGTSDIERIVGKAAVEAARMSNQASQAAKKFLGDVTGEMGDAKGYDLAAIDLLEGPEEIIALVALPGASKDKIDLRVTEDSLFVEAKPIIREAKYLRRETSPMGMRREMKLPVEIKPEQVKASFTDGILEVRLPKLVVINAQRVVVD